MVSLWDKIKEDTIKIEIQRAMIRAKRANQNDKLHWPQYVNEYATNKKDMIKKQVREKFEKFQADALERRAKRAGTK